MESTKAQLLLIATEFTFTYAVECVNTFLNFRVYNELSLYVDFPLFLSYYLYILLAFLSILFAIIADSLFGKYYVSLIGLIGAFLASLCCLLSKKYPTISLATGFMIVYSGTSAVRHTLIIEQLPIPLLYDRARFYILSLVIAKGLATYFSRWLFDEWLWNMFFSFLVIFTYSLIFLCFFGSIFYIEPTFICGVFKSLVAYVKYLRHKRIKKKRSDNLNFKSVLPVEGITIRYQYPHKPTAISRYWGISTTSTGEDYDTNVGTRLSEDWLEQNLYIIKQWYIFQQTLPFLFFGAAFSSLDLLIRIVSEVYFKEDEDDYYLYLIKSVLPSTLMDSVLIIAFEYLIFPGLSRFVRKDVTVFAIGYGILLFGGVILCCNLDPDISMAINKPSNVLPNLRIFNALEDYIVVSSIALSSTVYIQPLTFASLEIYPLDENKNTVITVGVAGQNTTNKFTVNVDEDETYSYIALSVNGGLFLYSRNLTDPKITRYDLGHELATFFLVPAVERDYVLLQLNFSAETRDIVQVIRSFDDKYTLHPGTYTVNLKMIEEMKFNQYIGKDKVTVKADQLYSIFLVIKNDTCRAYMHAVEYGWVVPYEIFFIDKFVTSLGRSFATVSFFRFLYLESPETMRSAVFTIHMIGNLPWFFFSDRNIKSFGLNSKNLFSSFIIAFLLYFPLFIVCLLWGFQFPHIYPDY